MTTIKNYFGEKIAFYYAFVSYYTASLMFVAIPGLLFVLHIAMRENNKSGGKDTPWLPIWVVYVVCWQTVMI